MLFEGLYTLLSGEATITALVGTKTSRKDKTAGIFPGRPDQGADMPCAAYSEVHGEGGANSLAGPDALQVCRLQFLYSGTTYADAKKLARTVRVFLENFTGDLTDGTRIASMLRIAEADTPIEGSDLFHTAQDFDVRYYDTGT